MHHPALTYFADPWCGTDKESVCARTNAQLLLRKQYHWHDPHSDWTAIKAFEYAVRATSRSWSLNALSRKASDCLLSCLLHCPQTDRSTKGGTAVQYPLRLVNFLCWSTICMRADSIGIIPHGGGHA